MERYHVFIRTWYRYTAPDYFGRRRKEPHMGQKTTLAHNVTWAEARAICEEYNTSHDPGPLSRKAEFEAE